MSSHLARATMLFSTLCACSEVVIVPATGGSGGFGGDDPPPVVGGAGGEAGSVNLGGFGGAMPGVVPGCEALQLAGDPVMVPGLQSNANYARLAPLAGDRAGLVYLDRLPMSGSDILVSHTLEAPFAAWPPTLGPRVEHLTEDFYNPPAPISSRLDGTFSLGFGVRGIFAFEQAGEVRAYEDQWLYAFPHPAAGSGIDVVSKVPSTFEYALHHLADLASPPTLIGMFPTQACSTMRAVFEEGSALYSSAPDWYCDDPAPHVELHRVTGEGLLTLGGFDLPFHPAQQTLAKRPGGYWYSASNDSDGIVVYALDASGVPVGEPWRDDDTDGFAPVMFQPWRDGFVVSHRNAEGISVYVSDGYNRTASASFPLEMKSSAEMALITGGPNEQSILFAYTTLAGVALFRADCFTPFK